MKLDQDSKLLRIFIGEIDKIGHQPLYEAIVFAARKQGMAGASVIRGIMSYGASTRVHTARLIEISEDLPIIVEIVDEEDKINRFMSTVCQLLEQANCGGLVTLEKAFVLYYKHRSKKEKDD